MADNVLKFKPTARTMIHVADDFLSVGNYPEAIDCLYRAYLKNKKDYEIMTRLGEAYTFIRDFNLAIMWFIRALNVNAKCDKIYAGIMQCYIDWGYGMSSAPFYYYTLGVKNGAFKTEDLMNGVYDDDLSDDDYEEAEEVIPNKHMSLKFANLRVTDSMKYEAGRKLFEENHYNSAYKSLKDIPDTNAHYLDAQRMLMEIDVSKGCAKSASERAEIILKEYPADASALIHGAVAYGEKYDLKRRTELYTRFAEIEDITPDQAGKGAAVAVALKKYEDAVRYLKMLKKIDPYNRSILLRMAQLYANLGDKARAKSNVIEALKLFPDDLTLKYYAEQIDALQGCASFEISDELPEEEAKAREKALDEWLLEKSTIGAVTAGLKENEKMREYLDWLFQEGDLDFQDDVAVFLAQSTKWKKYLETLLIDPSIDSNLKKEILISMFDNFCDCKVAVTTGHIYQKLSYNPPVGLNDLAAKTYRIAFVNLAFISDGYVRNLNKAIVALNPALNVVMQQETEPDAYALAAAVAYRCGIVPGTFKKKECLKLFDCDEERFAHYVKSLDLSALEPKKGKRSTESDIF